MGINYYISDTHFGHKNIIRYDNRPFRKVDEMDAALISRWNDMVSDDDTVYVLGDFSWHREEKTLEILDSLSGHKVLIKGNHDRVSPKIARKFDKVYDYLDISDNGTRVIMSHYPMPFWNGQFRNSVHLYGHVHNSSQWNVCESLRRELKALYDIPMQMINVGCMMTYVNYIPRTLNELLEAQKVRA